MDKILMKQANVVEGINNQYYNIIQFSSDLLANLTAM